jgi:hypothetical protein
LHNTEFLIEIIDCISSFAKSDKKILADRLVELGCIQHLFFLLSSKSDSINFYESTLRCLRSFFLPKLSTTFSKVDYSNPFLTPIPFVLLCDQDIHNPPSLINTTQIFPATLQLSSIEQNTSIDIIFDNSESLDILIHLLSTSKSAQLSIVEILCCLCVNNERQKQLADKDIISAILHLLVQNINDNNHNKNSLVR